MALPEGKSVLETIFEDGEVQEDDDILLDDVEMLDAEANEQDSDHHARLPEGDAVDGAVASRSESQRGLGVKDGGKRRRRVKKKKRAPSDVRVTDINKFVIDTCRHLRERKSYLIWNAVGCLGVSAVSDLVKEVDAVQNCGGQKTADGKRFRSGGGILWNILKSRDPKVYKEIMAKGREFERQFRPVKVKDAKEVKEVKESLEKEQDADVDLVDERPGSVAQELDDLKPTEEQDGKSSILTRVRKPVAYDDLFD